MRGLSALESIHRDIFVTRVNHNQELFRFLAVYWTAWRLINCKTYYCLDTFKVRQRRLIPFVQSSHSFEFISTTMPYMQVLAS